MGGGNGQKAKMAREKNLEKQKGAKGSQLETNKKAMSIQGLIMVYVEIMFKIMANEDQHSVQILGNSGLYIKGQAGA
ncbi:unnamed protein product [Linum tenue]|uniref:Small EDRK-rich factor-like N-terminal domain-containing protein n=1 Tax=Linum tenue TaxID=586396 RepID=A0AAV0PHW3_9ROSI|nr:unnamed protein product [Linum tenue]